MARSTNRGLAWSFLAGFPTEFPNVSQAVKWLQGQGIGYHFQTMWHDVRTAFDTFTKKPLQEAFIDFERLPQRLFIEKDWKRPETYNYYGNAWFIDPATGEESFRSYSLYADTSLSDAELAGIVYGLEEEKETEYGPGWKVTRFESLERSHKWGAPRSEGYAIAEI
jgi:hypothetical protein